MISWREAVVEAINRLVRRTGSKRFSRQDLVDQELATIVRATGSAGKTPAQTMSRVLQELREEGLLEFVDDIGNYRLK